MSVGAVIGMHHLAKTVQPIIDEQIAESLERLESERNEQRREGLSTAIEDEAIKRLKRVYTHGYWPE